MNLLNSSGKDFTKLKQVFNDPGSLLYTDTAYNLSSGTVEQPLELSFDYKFPVTVDTLQVNQDDPTINHYKIIGMAGDWTTSATLGNVSIQFTIPSIHPDALKAVFGEDAVAVIENIKLGETAFSGHALKLNKHKMAGTLAIAASNDKDVMLVSGTALYGKLLYDSTGSNPFAIQVSGGIEQDDEKPTIGWLTVKE